MRISFAVKCALKCGMCNPIGDLDLIYVCYKFTLEALSIAALDSVSTAMTTKCGPVSTSNINFANRGSTT